MIHLKLFFLLSVLCLLGGCATAPQHPFSIYVDDKSPQLHFGLDAIAASLKQQHKKMVHGNKNNANLFISISSDHAIAKEGFKLFRVDKNKLAIHASDSAGAMYGALELAEQITLYGVDKIQDSTQVPHVALRGTKFNIPLDVRTPSYTDASDPAQKNIATVWDMTFWKDYIDGLAKQRYNLISLWNLHPFPSMIKVPDYPKIALNDVQQATAPWDEYYHLHASGLDSPTILNNAKVIKKISIDEKITFWRDVMAYAKARNIQFYIVTWNVFTNGTFGQYGISDDVRNTTTKDYFRKSIYTLLETYPDLAGIGLTTGENMEGANFQQKEDWVFDTYGQGVLDFSTKNPERKITFIHRQHQADSNYIKEKFKPLIQNPSIEFVYSFKYAQAHIHSATTQPFHQAFIENIGDTKTLWTMRNDSNYFFRWGAPDFLRTLIQNVPTEPTKGMYYGSDQWVWGRDFTGKKNQSPAQLEIDKHWYHWMLFGRLAYDPSFSNERLTALLAHRFNIPNAGTLLSAWQDASMVYPMTTGFHWGALDFQWYIEGCKSRPKQAWNETGFHDVNTFLKLPTHPHSGYQSIKDFVLERSQGKQPHATLKSPLAVSAELTNTAKRARDHLAKIALNASTSHELIETINDIQTMAYMGDYYAAKIKGATYYALYLANGRAEDKQESLQALTQALAAWKLYVKSASTNNITRVWLNRVGIVDLEKTTEWVQGDIDIVNKAKPDAKVAQH